MYRGCLWDEPWIPWAASLKAYRMEQRPFLKTPKQCLCRTTLCVVPAACHFVQVAGFRSKQGMPKCRRIKEGLWLPNRVQEMLTTFQWCCFPARLLTWAPETILGVTHNEDGDNFQKIVLIQGHFSSLIEESLQIELLLLKNPKCSPKLKLFDN